MIFYHVKYILKIISTGFPLGPFSIYVIVIVFEFRKFDTSIF